MVTSPILWYKFAPLCVLWWLLLLAGLCAACSSAGEKRRVLVIHSYEREYAAYPDFNEMIAGRFRQGGVQADIRTLYLDCESYGEQAEIEFMRSLLDSLGDWKPEVILVNDDQAVYSFLKCGHPLVRSTPIVFAGVNYPNLELIKHFPNVTGFHDKPNYAENVKVIERIMGERVRVFLLQDRTYLDRMIRSDLKVQMDAIGVPIRRDDRFKVSGLGKVTSALPAMKETAVIIMGVRIDSLGGAGVIWAMSRYSEQTHYLQTKRDFVTVNVGNISANTSFTTINEAMGYGENLLAGYFTPLWTQVNEQVDAATRILKGSRPQDMPIQVSGKEYVIDWEVMKKRGMDRKQVPPGYVIVNMPFSERYWLVTTLLIVFVAIAILSLIAWLVFIYQCENQRKKNALAALRKEKQALALALEGGNSYVWEFREGLFVFADEFWRSMGVTPRKISVDEFRSMISLEERASFDLNKYNLRQDGKRTVQYQCNFDGKGYVWMEYRYRVTTNELGENELSGLMINIREQKEREQELIEARKLAEKAELKQSFLANMSHEIRTPLNAIVGFSNILAVSDDLSPEEKEDYVSTINSNNALLLKLINDILELSRMESGFMSFELKKCSVRTLVDEAYRTHQMLMPPALEFRKEDCEINVEINVDKERLAQVLTNFLNNAAKFTREGYIKLGYSYDGLTRCVSIYVEDSGKGIPKQEQQMIFSRFYKQDEFAQGTGLGLSICQVIIGKLGGTIELWSEPGKGSRFTIVLPAEVPDEKVNLRAGG